MIIFVAGYPCSGKSTYINDNFPNYKKIDLFDFQQFPFPTVQNVLESYKNAGIELINAIKTHENVVFEHTLLKKIRREEYIKLLRDNGIDEDIELHFLVPDDIEYSNRLKSRGIEDKKIPYFIKIHKEVLEIPTSDELFSNIKIIK